MPTHRPRTPDQLYGTGITPDEAPHVERHVDGEDYSVDVDLTPAAGTLLEALAAAVASEHGLRMEWTYLMQQWINDGDRSAGAVRALLASPRVRQALTIRLTPETAVNLGRRLWDESLEPERCDQYDHGDRCQYYAAEGETTCPRHLPADPEDAR